MRLRSCWVFLLLLSLLLSCKGEAATETKVETVTKPVTKVSISEPIGKYDLSFKRWGEFYFPFDDWRWWKSQGIAESNLDPNAVSWCGAVGVMQIMPATATDLSVKNRWSAEESIQGGIHYDKQMDVIFKNITQPERRKFTFGGYNAGPGNIKKAKSLANSELWDATADSLCLVTGHHSAETIGYVKKIYSVKQIL